jgi:hypothetical protein
MSDVQPQLLHFNSFKKKTYVTANVTRHFTKRHVQEKPIVTLQLAVVLDEALRGGEFIKTGKTSIIRGEVVRV